MYSKASDAVAKKVSCFVLPGGDNVDTARYTLDDDAVAQHMVQGGMSTRMEYGRAALSGSASPSELARAQL